VARLAQIDPGHEPVLVVARAGLLLVGWLIGTGIRRASLLPGRCSWSRGRGGSQSVGSRDYMLTRFRVRVFKNLADVDAWFARVDLTDRQDC
jgi:hypothetical protein